MKKLLFPVLLALLVVSSCQMDINLSTEVQLYHEGSSDWMASLPDYMLLRDMTIPGTHDTCANFDFLGLSSTAAAQDLTLAEQLDAGVRYVDIRPCLEKGELIVRHGAAKQHVTFSAVLSTLENFLVLHPEETLILAILPEYTDSEDYSNSYAYLKSLTSDVFLEGVDIQGRTLGECRGRILVVSRGHVPSSMSDVFCSGYTETGAAAKTTDLKEQWNLILSALEKAPFSKVTAVYSAGYFEGQFGIPNIRIASSAINPRLQRYLEEQETAPHFGIIVSDHMTRNLAASIYLCNFLP